MKCRLCTIGQTVIRLHAATLIMAVYMMLLGQGRTLAWSMLSILLHEGAHALAACLFGASPQAIEITPLGAMMRLEDESRLSSGKRILMLAAGPAVTLGLCGCAWILASHRLLDISVCAVLFRVNAGFLLMNLLPCLPLDGGRILHSLLTCLLPVRVCNRIMRWIGIVTGAGCMLLSAVITWKTGALQLSLAACGCVMLYAACTSTAAALLDEMRQWADRKTRMEQRGMLPVKRMAVMEHYPLRLLIARLPPRARAEFIVLETGTMRVVNRMTEEAAFRHYISAPWAQCGQIQEDQDYAEPFHAAHR